MGDKNSKLVSFVLMFTLCTAGFFSLSAGETINSDESLQLLIDGNSRFVNMKMQHPNETI